MTGWLCVARRSVDHGRRHRQASRGQVRPWMRCQGEASPRTVRDDLRENRVEDPKGGVKVSRTTRQACRPRCARPPPRQAAQGSPGVDGDLQGDLAPPLRRDREGGRRPIPRCDDVEAVDGDGYDPGNHRVVVNQDHVLEELHRRPDTYRDPRPGAHAAVTAAEPTWLSSASLVVAHQMKLAEEAPDKRRELWSRWRSTPGSQVSGTIWTQRPDRSERPSERCARRPPHEHQAVLPVDRHPRPPWHRPSSS